MSKKFTKTPRNGQKTIIINLFSNNKKVIKKIHSTSMYDHNLFWNFLLENKRFIIFFVVFLIVLFTLFFCFQIASNPNNSASEIFFSDIKKIFKFSFCKFACGDK